jgi:hypothetical protein
MEMGYCPNLEVLLSLVSFQTKVSDFLALMSSYPTVQWHPWLFKHISIPKGFWNDASHRKSFFDWFAEQMALKSPSDWYNVTSKDVIAKGGSGLLTYYKGSVNTGTLYT